jgi:hypothetical protein
LQAAPLAQTSPGRREKETLPQTPLLHRPLEHSLGDMHGRPSSSGAVTHAPRLQNAAQQSLPDEQASPVARQSLMPAEPARPPLPPLVVPPMVVVPPIVVVPWPPLTPAVGPAAVVVGDPPASMSP